MKSKQALRVFVIIFTLFLLSLLTFSQTGSTATGSSKKYKKGKIIKSDKTVHRGRNIFWDSQILTYNDEKTGQTVTLQLSEVDRVIKVGNYIAEGALGFGLTVLCVGLLSLAEAEVDPGLKPREEAGAIIAGVTVGGVLAGALIGSNISKEKTIYSKGAVQTQISLLPRFVNTGGKSIGISFLTVNFLF